MLQKASQQLIAEQRASVEQAARLIRLSAVGAEVLNIHIC